MITLCDTGPLVAYLNRNDIHHQWAVKVMKTIRPPMLTSEAVLTETASFLREDVETTGRSSTSWHLRVALVKR